MPETTIPVCPFSIRGNAPSVLVAPKLSPDVSMAPCLGPQCMAFTVITDRDGRPVRHDCRLCMGPQNALEVAVHLAEISKRLESETALSERIFGWFKDVLFKKLS